MIELLQHGQRLQLTESLKNLEVSYFEREVFLSFILSIGLYLYFNLLFYFSRKLKLKIIIWINKIRSSS